MRLSNMNETTIDSQKCSEYDDILSTLCVFNILYNTGHSLQQLERIARIKSQSTETIMKGKCV